MVMIEWAWSYLTLQRGARLITHESAEQPHKLLDRQPAPQEKKDDMVRSEANGKVSEAPRNRQDHYQGEDTAHPGQS